MSGKSFLLDTSVIIQIFRGKNAAVKKFIDTLHQPYISVITIGELLYGAKYSQNKEQRLQQVYTTIAQCVVLDTDQQTSEHYSEIRTALRTKGKPIPENDIWIAATAQQYDCTLVAMDKHFREIPTLELKEL